MARKRMISPSIWEDEDLGVVSHGAFRLFVGLFSCADDYGRISASPQALKRAIFGFDDTTLDQIEGYLDEVKRVCRHLVVYEIDGRRYATHLKWGEFQNLHKPQPSSIPCPPGYFWKVEKETEQYARGKYVPVSTTGSDNEKPLSDAVEPSLNPASTGFRVVEKNRSEEKSGSTNVLPDAETAPGELRIAGAARKAEDSKPDPKKRKRRPLVKRTPEEAAKAAMQLACRSVLSRCPHTRNAPKFLAQYERLGEERFCEVLENWRRANRDPEKWDDIGALKVLEADSKAAVGPKRYVPAWEAKANG